MNPNSIRLTNTGTTKTACRAKSHEQTVEPACAKIASQRLRAIGLADLCTSAAIGQTHCRLRMWLDPNVGLWEADRSTTHPRRTHFPGNLCNRRSAFRRNRKRRPRARTSDGLARTRAATARVTLRW